VLPRERWIGARCPCQAGEGVERRRKRILGFSPLMAFAVTEKKIVV